MPLTPIGDIGTATLSETQANTDLVWETASDWDAAASESKTAVHASHGDLPGDGTVTIGFKAVDETGQGTLLAYYPLEDDSGPVVDATGNWPDGSVDGGVSYSAGAGLWGRDTWTWDESDADITVPQPSDLPTGSATRTVVLFKNDDSDSDEHTWFAYGQDGTADYSYSVRSHNHPDDAFFFLWSDDLTISGYNGQTEAWEFIGTALDSAGDQYGKHETATNTRSTAGPNTQASDVHFGNRNDQGANQEHSGEIGHIRVYDHHLSFTQMEDLRSGVTQASLTTATKSYATATTPDLANLSYSLNQGSLNISAIGSPGTASEETQSWSADGSTSHDFTWADSHADFRISLSLSTSAYGDSPPTVSSITLTPP